MAFLVRLLLRVHWEMQRITVPFFIRFLLFMFASLLYVPAFADSVPQAREFRIVPLAWRSIPEDACEDGKPVSPGYTFTVENVLPGPPAVPLVCWYGYQQVGAPYQTHARSKALDNRLACPANSILLNGMCVCSAGTVATSAGLCVPPLPTQCAANAGKVSTMNFTAGWTRDGTLDTPVGNFTAPGVSYQSACVNGCKVAIGDVSSQSAWVSTVPAPSGLYRASIDSDVVGMGESCTETTPEANPAAPYMPCPGFVGEINGKTTCVGTADSPLPAGSGDTKPTRDAQNPTDSNGNPTAGSKPATGEGSGSGGSGRTPSAGTGTAAGGPAGAAGSGTKPDGTKDKPGEGKEQANCGVPGQPKCGIDETGTPKKFDGDGKGLDEWKAKMESNRDEIKGAGDGIFSGMNLFFSAPPVAGCSAYDLPRDMGSIDPCGVADGVRAVMAYVWALGVSWSSFFGQSDRGFL